VTSFSRAAAGRLLDLPDGTRPQPIVCPGHPAEDLPPPIRAPLERP
jgi:hypothetical protein